MGGEYDVSESGVGAVSASDDVVVSDAVGSAVYKCVISVWSDTSESDDGADSASNVEIEVASEAGGRNGRYSDSLRHG